MDLDWLFKRTSPEKKDESSSESTSTTEISSDEEERDDQSQAVSINHVQNNADNNVLSNNQVHEQPENPPKNQPDEEIHVRHMIPFLFPTLGDLPGLLVASSPGSVFRNSQWNNIRKRFMRPKKEDKTKHETPGLKLIPKKEKKIVIKLAPPPVEDKNEIVENDVRISRYLDTHSLDYDISRNIIRIPVTSESGQLLYIDEVELDGGFSELQVMPGKLDAFLACRQSEIDLNFDISATTIPNTSMNASYYRGIYLTMFLLALIILTYAGGAAVFLLRANKPGNPYTCRTSNCQRMAHWIKSAMDTKVNPCDNFYHFACGTYIKTHPVSKESESPSEIHLYRNGLPTNYKENERIGNFLKKVSNFPDNQLLPYYQACIDTRRRDKHGVKPLVHLLARVGLLNPQSGAYYSVISKLNVGRAMGSIYRKTNKLFFFDFDEVKDNMMLMRVAKPPQEIILTSPKVYADAMKRCWQAFSKDLLIEDPEEIDTIVYLVMRFEAEVGIIQSKETENYIFGFPVHFDEVVPPPAKFHSNYLKMRGRFEWDELIAAIMGYTPGNYPEFRYSINLWSSFYTKQDKYYALYIVDKLRNTPAYVLFRYFQWGLMKLFAFELNKEIQDIMLTIFRASGQTVLERCFRSVFSNLHILAAHHYKAGIKDMISIYNNMTTITDFVFNTFTDAVSKLDLPDAMKASLLASSRTLKIVLIDPESELNAHLDVYYDKLNCTKEHFVNVVQAKSIKARNRVLLATKKPPFENWWDGEYSLTEWTETSTADAYSTIRYLRVPFAAIQEPYLGNDLPILNYAGYGFFMVSLALIRLAFDDLFQVYESNLRIWEPRDEVVAFKEFQQAFLATTECVINTQSDLRLKQYPGVKLNQYNRETKMRMFAYTFSLELIDLVFDKLIKATQARKGSVYPYKSPMDELFHANEMIGKRFPKYQILPGLEKYSPKQLALLGMARQYCQSYTEAKATSRMTNGPVLSEIMMHGGLRNLKHFSEVWKCPKNSFMNPKKRCHLLTGELENTIVGNPRASDGIDREASVQTSTNGPEHYYDDSDEEKFDGAQ